MANASQLTLSSMLGDAVIWPPPPRAGGIEVGARDMTAHSAPIPTFPRTRGKEKTNVRDGKFALTD